jgi:hypothetical protein
MIKTQDYYKALPAISLRQSRVVGQFEFVLKGRGFSRCGVMFFKLTHYPKPEAGRRKPYFLSPPSIDNSSISKISVEFGAIPWLPLSP